MRHTKQMQNVVKQENSNGFYSLPKANNRYDVIIKICNYLSLARYNANVQRNPLVIEEACITFNKCLTVIE